MSQSQNVSPVSPLAEIEINTIRLKSFIKLLSTRISNAEIHKSFEELPFDFEPIRFAITQNEWVNADQERTIIDFLCRKFDAWSILEETGKASFDISYTSFLPMRYEKITVRNLIKKIPAIVSLYISHFQIFIKFVDGAYRFRLEYRPGISGHAIDILFIAGLLKGIFYLFQIQSTALTLISCTLKKEDVPENFLHSEQFLQQPDGEIRWGDPYSIFALSVSEDKVSIRDISRQAADQLAGDDESDITFLEAVLARTAELLKDKRELLTAVEYLHMANNELERKIHANKKELKMARAIQKGIIPQHIPDWHGLQFYIHFKPLTEVSGDYYDYFPMGNQIGIMVGDVSGHGVPAALITAISKLSFMNHKLDSPANIFRKVNMDLLNFVKGEGYLTSFYMIINTEYNMLYCNAGAPSPIILRAKTGFIERFAYIGTLLGAFPNAGENYYDKSNQLQAGDKIFFFTDALTESVNVNNVQFSEQRIIDAILESKDLDIQGSIEHIMDNFHKYMIGAEMLDDITVIGLMLNPRVNEYEQYVSEGKGNFAHGNIREACRLMRKAVEILPNNTLSLYLLGKYMALGKEYDEALLILDKYIHLKAYNADAYLIIGYCYYKMGQYRQALENFKKSLSLRTDNPKCLYNMTKVFIKLNRPDDARLTMARLVHFKPNHPQVRHLKKYFDSLEQPEKKS